MKLIFSLLIAIFSFQFSFASIECEKKFAKHFESLEIDVKQNRESFDYLNAEAQLLGKQFYARESKRLGKEKFTTEQQPKFDKFLKDAAKFETIDSRYNEIIRVCSAIRAFAEVGVSEDEIELKTLPFQNGWSEPMRAPLKAAIKKEVKQLKAADEINDICEAKAQRAAAPKSTGAR